MAVQPESIGAQGIEGDQDQIRGALFRPGIEEHGVGPQQRPAGELAAARRGWRCSPPTTQAQLQLLAQPGGEVDP